MSSHCCMHTSTHLYSLILDPPRPSTCTLTAGTVHQQAFPGRAHTLGSKVEVPRICQDCQPAEAPCKGSHKRIG